ncbi:hypothetical protein I2486_08645 [Cellulophaga sp. E16_2]|uniref:hypothetical protein n=1 Tax=Cellulophaga sp. E16_2 TaxID=2789297 RepID=UPI001A91EF57|nr:hypothetical protein [Cellulophaga sp. E16_2]MBO0591475.1 hypothetical protein [Cellulophaga sp. E16_2]
MNPKNYITVIGAQHNNTNKFSEFTSEICDDFLEFCRIEGEDADKNKRQYLPIFPKSIINKMTSPDIGMEYSINPYQGCEHGCIYCYARNTHEFWGLAQRLILNRAAKVVHQIAECHGGTLNDSRFGKRSRGEGKIATQIHDLMHIAKRTYFKNSDRQPLHTSLHKLDKGGPLKLF